MAHESGPFVVILPLNKEKAENAPFCGYISHLQEAHRALLQMPGIYLHCPAYQNV